MTTNDPPASVDRLLIYRHEMTNIKYSAQRRVKFQCTEKKQRLCLTLFKSISVSLGLCQSIFFSFHSSSCSFFFFFFAAVYSDKLVVKMCTVSLNHLFFAGSTLEELARLCGSGPDGWLCSSHIMWILDRINETPQATSLGICISASPPDKLARLIQRKDVSNVERLIFVANVGKNPDNSVFLSTPFRSGSHWVLITIELTDHPVILYCDSRTTRQIFAGAL